MKAIKADSGAAQLVDIPEPQGAGVKIKVVASSICGSDLHMLRLGFFGDAVIGHEFSGLTPDGTAVAIEPTIGCGHCVQCGEGYNGHCEAGLHLMGLMSDGGMAEYVMAPARNLVTLPTGLDVRAAALVEPLAVAVHGLDRARVREGERVLVIGAGPIGLAAVVALSGRGIDCDIIARHDHQRVVAAQMGASLAFSDGYDVVIDAVGSADSLADAVQRLRPMGRIGLLGTFWEDTPLNAAFCMREIEVIASTGYRCQSPRRSFEEAGQLMAANPSIADALITHRFPLEGVAEAFATAADRSAGAIKVTFDIG